MEDRGTVPIVAVRSVWRVPTYVDTIRHKVEAALTGCAVRELGREMPQGECQSVCGNVRLLVKQPSCP